MSLSKRNLVQLSTLALLVLTLIFSGFATVSAEDKPKDWKAPRRAARKKNPEKATAASIAAGKRTFQKECVSCHGAKGKGDGAAAKDFKIKPRDLTSAVIAKQSDGTLFWKITNGRAPMTAFKTLLTEKKRWQVINYIKTLGGKKALPKKKVVKKVPVKKVPTKKLDDESAVPKKQDNKTVAHETDDKAAVAKRSCTEAERAKEDKASDSRSVKE